MGIIVNTKNLNCLVRITLILTICLSTFISGFSQEKKLKKGIDQYNSKNYFDAIQTLKKYREVNDSSYTPIKYLANSYRKIREYQNAELYYLLTVNSDSSIAEDHLYYGQALKANGKLAAAKNQFLIFSKINQNDFLGNIMIQSIDEVESWEQAPKAYKIKTESTLNSPFSEYGIILFNKTVLFTSNRDKNENSPESSLYDDSPFYSIYEFDSSEIKNDGKGKIRMSTGQINSDYHDGPLTINEQEDRLIITRIDNQMRGKDFVNRMKLFQAVLVNGKWRSFEPLPFNSDEFSVCHAHLSDSGRTVFFASDMPGGMGGFDLYMSKLEKGNWTKPKNLGKAINTSKNELFPFELNKILYFSSDGFPGYGGLDIFYSTFNGGWQAPDNMKSPINSSRDDFSIYFINDTTGYYASNREGGVGDDDLYRFNKQKPLVLVDINGVYELKGLPMDSVKIMLLDNKDSIISIQYTDDKGRFKFIKLPYNHEFIVKIDELDEELVKSGRMFLTDDLGKKLKLLSRLKDETFKFRALPFDEFGGIDQLAEKDILLSSPLFLAGRLFQKLPGDFSKKKMVYLTTGDGEIIDSVFTDANGFFNFKKLKGTDESYLIRLKEEDPGLNLALENTGGRIYEIIEADGKGNYTIADDLDASIRSLEARNIGMTSLLAKIEHRGLPLKAIKVNIYDKESNLIGTVYTNDKGEFQFNKLEFDDTYFLELPELEGKILYESVVYVTDTEGDPLYLINQLKNGRYKFNSLPFDEYKLVQQEEAAYVPHIIKIAGQIYKKLPGDYSEGMQVYILDSEGHLVDSVLTDSKGRFNFEKLGSDQNYTFKLKGVEEDFNLALIDSQDRIMEVATINANGNFAYKKLTYQVAQFEPLEELDIQLIEDELNHEIMGQVYQKLPGDFQHGMKVFVYDEDGNLLGITETDAEGRFHFKKLKKDQNYFFKIEDEDDHFQLVTIDEFDKVIDKTIKNKHGQFKYTSLSMDMHEILLAEERDHMILDLGNEKITLENVSIHYRFDSMEVRSQDKPRLDSIILVFKNTSYVLEVHSFTDNRGPAVYNEWLSKTRTDKVIRYLSRNGFPRERIIGNYSGELNPVVDCNTQECDNDDHFLNRRTEFKLLQPLK